MFILSVGGYAVDCHRSCITQSTGTIFYSQLYSIEYNLYVNDYYYINATDIFKANISALLSLLFNCKFFILSHLYLYLFFINAFVR